jgi:predicted metal-dependent peptidase
MTDPAADKLSAARTRLILDKPFLGALAMRLPLVAAGSWCRTTASDARQLYYNPAWIAELSTAQAQFVLAHEALHCALGHFARRGHRVKRRWDLACDFAVNPLLVAEGLTPPVEAIVLDLYAGMAAEEIYPCLDDSLENDTLDDHVWDGDDGGQGASGDQEARGQGAGSRQEQDSAAGGATPKVPWGGRGEGLDGPPPPLSGKEQEQLEQQWQRNLAAAAQRARESGKLAGALARLVEAALAPTVSWRALLAQYLSQLARDDYSYQRPHRRGDAGGSGGSVSQGGEPILPSLRSRAGDLVVALDISGSVGDQDLARFVAELNAIKGALPVRVFLLACDAALAPDAPWLFDPWQSLELPRKFQGGGGTDFTPVFSWVDREGLRPDALIYFTDADGPFPVAEPDYPVLWLVKGNKPVPWGQRVPLND